MSDFSINIEENKQLEAYNTFKIKANAKYFVEINHFEQLKSLLSNQVFQKNKYFILGGGSNVLFTNDFDGIIVHINTKGIEIIEENDEYINVEVAAGEVWDEFVEFCCQNNYWGVENLSLIPGYVGSCPVQNIGAYGAEAKDCIERVKVLDIASGKIQYYNNKECNFGYRFSNFKTIWKGRYIIVSVIFKLKKTYLPNLSYAALAKWLNEKGIETPNIHQIREAVIAIRRSKLPDHMVIGNAGSFFKNPVVNREEYQLLIDKFPRLVSFKQDDYFYKLAAGWLIEYCGWKGKELNGAGVHHEQALVLVNKNHATGSQILHLANQIQADVQATFGIKLEFEVNIV